MLLLACCVLTSLLALFVLPEFLFWVEPRHRELNEAHVSSHLLSLVWFASILGLPVFMALLPITSPVRHPVRSTRTATRTVDEWDALSSFTALVAVLLVRKETSGGREQVFSVQCSVFSVRGSVFGVRCSGEVTGMLAARLRRE